MNSVKSYFVSPIKTLNNATTGSSSPVVGENPTPIIIRTPRPDSKLILQNMEEVLNSVKKKHKQKHRRKKEEKRRAMLIEANKSENKSNLILHSDYDLKNQKSPLKECTRQTNGHSSKSSKSDIGNELKSPTKHPSILNHFAKAVIKTSSIPGDITIGLLDSDDESPETPQSTKVNVFQVMMNARNKPIGSNSQGLELSQESEKNNDSGEKQEMSKRKQTLQLWADKKGALKRRVDDEIREEYIENEMKKRAKRFKKILTSSNNSPHTSSSVSISTTPSPNKIIVIPAPSSSSKDEEEEAILKKKPFKKRIARLVSMENETVNEFTIENEFLENLSSPIKKRDSLLGYFPKIVSPTKQIDKNVIKQINDIKSQETPKSRGAPKKSVTRLTQKISPNQNITTSTPVASASRPKRSCVGKAKYDSNYWRSPSKSPTKAKSSTAQNSNAKKTQAKTCSNTPDLGTSDCIILDDTDGTPKKLAPLFVKTLPKPKVDLEIQKARNDFLMSGVTEKVRLDMEKQKQFEKSYSNGVDLFPLISHITQLNNWSIPKPDWPKTTFVLKDEDISCNLSPTIKKRCCFTNCTEKDYRINTQKKKKEVITSFALPPIEDKINIIKEWKIKYEKFPTYKCYNQLREKYRYFSAIDSNVDTKQLTESFVVTRQTRQAKPKDEASDNDKPPPSVPNGELLFTEKYKPMSLEQILVNATPVHQLKVFLSAWQTGRHINQSMAEFEDSNDSISMANSSSIVLLGPESSGKSNAVSALANEMHFNVLEINAGMKRTGKKLLQELKEATQSHQIRKDKTARETRHKTCLTKSLKNKVFEFTGDSSSSNDFGATVKMSLILVEDADIIFEQHDAGFIDAIYTLASTSKRPVIIIASNPNCEHLQRLIKQNSIHFNAPNTRNVSKYLSVLSLVENCPVDLDDIRCLYLYNKNDLRKTINEMQFFIQSGGDNRRIKNANSSMQYFVSPTKNNTDTDDSSRTDEGSSYKEFIKNKSSKINAGKKFYKHKHFFEFYTVAQNCTQTIPFPIDFNLLRINLNDFFHTSDILNPKSKSASPIKRQLRKSKSPKLQKTSNESSSGLEMLCEFYDNISIAECLDNNYDNDRLKHNQNEEIAHFLVEKSIKVNLDVEPTTYNLFEESKDRVYLTSYMSTNTLQSNRSLSLDYEPALRDICRSERSRSQLERRGSRFYHYLRNSCLNLNTFSTELFNSASLTFNDSENQPKNE